MDLRASFAALVVAVGVVGCTEPNPNYLGEADGDSGAIADQRVADQPTMPPERCQDDADCDDELACTSDSCEQGVCRFQLQPDRCLIDGACVMADEKRPGDPCQLCDPALDDAAWSAVPDSTPCTADAFDCTADVCRGGSCQHPVTDGCLIDGACVAEGAGSEADECHECVNSASADSYTFVDGKPCGEDAHGVCVIDRCRRWEPHLLSGTVPLQSSASAVAYIKPSGMTWIAAEALDNRGRSDKHVGVLLALDGIAVPLVVGSPFVGMHHRLALTKGGSPYRYGNSGWQEADELAAALSDDDRLSVWGGVDGGHEVYLLGGSSPAVTRCERKGGGGFTCTAQQGFGGETIGGIFGVFGPSPRAWAAAFGSFENIYAHKSGVQWSTTPPAGCFDEPGTPCHTPFITDFADIAGSSADDVWLVGSAGMLMHYDGSGWRRHDNVFSFQGDYQLDAVYSDAARGLTLIVGHRDFFGGPLSGRYVSTFTHNARLDRWWGPITIEHFAGVHERAELRDIGGESLDQLWAVGHQPGSDSTSWRVWVLKLQ